MAVKYTQIEINNIVDKLDVVLLKYSNKIYNKYALGIDCLSLVNYYKVWLYKKIIKNWNIDESSIIYNSISDDQFNIIVTDALNYCK